MSRYIDIEPYEKDGWYLQKYYHNSNGEAMVTIPLISVPTAESNSCEYWDSESHFCALRRPQAEPVKHGRWIDGKCSVCGGHAPFWAMATTYYRSDYCPNCGAKIDLDEVKE